MTEAQVTSQLLAVLRRFLPGAVVFKFADRATLGVPDFCVTWKNATSWTEVKVVQVPGWENRPTYLHKVLSNKLQLETMRRLAINAVPAFYLIYAEKKCLYVNATFAEHLVRNQEAHEFTEFVDYDTGYFFPKNPTLALKIWQHLH